ncbi:4-galactosyl-N-acetylglucosaminide 3-alpha-L-fucosyltransferase 9-like [Antennarius striatus]|uniref:4-galactosyl-N-acetylglucosaminide 3-alpha-L-fucosyltransferase 9-like n=1 Tax=Antennarius striatus TaxID=241820 RepID=UPI0035B2D0C1
MCPFKSSVMSSIPGHRKLHLVLLGTILLGYSVYLFLLYYDPSTSLALSPVNSRQQTEQVKSVIPNKSNNVVPNKRIDVVQSKSNDVVPNKSNDVIPNKCNDIVSNRSNDDVITLLMWTWPSEKRGELNWCSSRYNIEGCFITPDRNFYNKADGVIFHHQYIHKNGSNLPKLCRPVFQKWIWLNGESPTRSVRIPMIENLFNLTSNYRQDSKIPVPYGVLVPADGKEEFVLPRKNKLVCWIVSNWKPTYARVKYFNEFKKHIKVNTYGSAFGVHISRKEYLSTITSCKFYLGFENSIDRDYITEKFYNPLSVGTVPVVLGPPRHNYENVIQGDAFIHVDDFSSPKELADHLLLLDKNEEMYLRFFEWKRYFKVRRIFFLTEHVCVICEYLRKHKEYQTLSKFGEWYWEN